jgi:hypothetical protein
LYYKFSNYAALFVEKTVNYKSMQALFVPQKAQRKLLFSCHHNINGKFKCLPLSFLQLCDYKHASPVGPIISRHAYSGSTPKVRFPTYQIRFGLRLKLDSDRVVHDTLQT